MRTDLKWEEIAGELSARLKDMQALRHPYVTSQPAPGATTTAGGGAPREDPLPGAGQLDVPPAPPPPPTETKPVMDAAIVVDDDDDDDDDDDVAMEYTAPPQRPPSRAPAPPTDIKPEVVTLLDDVDDDGAAMRYPAAQQPPVTWAPSSVETPGSLAEGGRSIQLDALTPATLEKNRPAGCKATAYQWRGDSQTWMVRFEPETAPEPAVLTVPAGSSGDPRGDVVPPRHGTVPVQVERTTPTNLARAAGRPRAPPAHACSAELDKTNINL